MENKHLIIDAVDIEWQNMSQNGKNINFEPVARWLLGKS